MALSFPTSPTSGQVYAAPNGVVYTWNNTVGVWTATGSTVGSIISGTPQNATGTSVDFTGIPAGVKRVTVMFNGVSKSGSGLFDIRLGDSGGIEATGYISKTSLGDNSATYTASSTTGFTPAPDFLTANTVGIVGSYVFVNISGTTWIGTGNFCSDSAVSNSSASSSGSKTLTGTLDRLSVTSVSGAETFDAGQINILYEF